MKRRFTPFVLLCVGLLTLVFSAVFVPLMKSSVDGGLGSSASSALTAAGVRGVTASSDWATVTLTGPQSDRAVALAAVGKMAHAGAVDHFVYRVGGSSAASGTFVTLTATVSGTPATVTIIGTTATSEQRHDIIEAAFAGFGRPHVVNRVDVKQGQPASADAAAVPQFCDLLKAFGPAVASGSARLASGAITVTASGRTSAGTATANAALNAAKAAGVSVTGHVDSTVRKG